MQASSSVGKIVERYPDGPIGAREIIETLLEIHTEYGRDQAALLPIAWPPVPGAVAPAEEYLEWIGEVFRRDAFDGTIHGRAAILGAGLVDRAVGRELVASGIFELIADELHEPIETALSPDGLRRYDSIPLASLRRRPPLALASTGGPAAVGQSRDGRWIAIGVENRLTLYRGDTPVLSDIAMPSTIAGLAVGAAGRKILVGMTDGWGMLTVSDESFEPVTPEPFPDPNSSVGERFHRLYAAAADGSRLFAVPSDAAEIRALSQDETVRSFATGAVPASGIVVSPTGLFVAWEDADGVPVVLDTRTGQRREEPPPSQVPGQLAVDDDGRIARTRLPPADVPQYPAIWVSNRGEEHRITESPVLAFSPDGRFLAGLVEKDIVLLDVAPRPDPSQELPSISLHQVAEIGMSGAIDWLQFSGDGHRLLAADLDGGSVWQWQVGLTPPPLPPAPLAYNADMADGRGDDLVGIDPAVDAFASLIAARDLEPPLSVGIFGHWGSGKTFFMRRLRSRIEERSTMARESGMMQREVSFAKRIVQVEFNAWHYSGGNLWAALVQHIFENLSLFGDEPQNEVVRRQKHILDEMRELDRERTELFEQLSTTEKEESGVKAALGELEKDHAARLAELRGLRPTDVTSALAQSPELRGGINTLAAEMGVEQVGVSAAAAYDALQETRALLQRASPFLAVDRGTGWEHSRLVLAATVLSGPAVAVAGAVASGPLGAVISGVAAALASGTAWLKEQNGWLRSKVEQAERLQAGLERRMSAAAADYTAQRAALDKELDALAGQITSVKGQIARTEADQAALRQTLAETTPANVLASYVMERASSDDYREHLGLHARIKDDFDRIAGIMDADRARVRDAPSLAEENADAEHRIDRIVLYIDDLDRCEPEKVVEVLGAVHLLLAFPLFVVVVGIDARWASHALRDKFPQLLSGGDDDPSQASPEDYLEKIFQIPYWLPRINAERASDFVAGMVGGGDAGRVEPRGEPIAPPGSAEPASGTGRQQRSGMPPSTKATPLRTTAAPSRPELNPAALQMGNAERAFMRDHVAPLLGSSPRAIKRFVNLYRLAKATAPDSLDFVTMRTGYGAPYEAVMILLAIDTGWPDDARNVFEGLARWSPSAGRPDTIGEATEVSRLTPDALSPAIRAVVDWVDEDPRRGEIHMQLVRSWLPTIARFSFRVPVPATI